MIAWEQLSGWFRSKKPVDVPVLRQSITVMVFTDAPNAAEPGKLTAAHSAALDAFRKIPPGRRRMWSAMVFEDFRRAIKSGQCELRSDDVPKRCRRAAQVWDLIEWSEVVVLEQGPNGDRFILVHGHPDWRIEHGVQLVLKNEQLLWVGRADQDLFSRGNWAGDYVPRVRW
ncbi:MAG TPA: hypothetical protein VMZ71_17255 [Gemmataceae bacterium]|nr:hypothetical protein [Gemmataceae bacterium]